MWYKEYTEYKLIRYRKDYKMSFSREQLRNIRVEMQNNLTSLGYVSSGLTFKVGNCSYDDDTATFKVVVTLPNAVAPEVKPVIVSLTLSTTSSTPSLTSPLKFDVRSIMLSFI